MSRIWLPALQRYKFRICSAIEAHPARETGLWNWVCAVLTLAALVAPVISAQTPGTVAIVGVVLDPSGAAVGNAAITIIDRAIRIERSVTTATDGSFRSSLLPLGTYSITVNAAGFMQEDLPAVAVLASETTTVAFKLKLGTGKTVIE